MIVKTRAVGKTFATSVFGYQFFFLEVPGLL